ncbi:hypothetical protein Caci_0138 [Catenulispora acidiphila DSM 44928]|uniref:Uncharacterized protein n=1 Tax=Catenulispora acidiphila (strain DSM 44928 / JCM 14897 / NBRC 102108 / NRRL B-24433 / ID139908) TaxID=479433 RepID=C7QHF4_CATAD|nr:hypothetical protein Caci_0138 [Catenulispora acidiphila DSM 44928]
MNSLELFRLRPSASGSGIGARVRSLPVTGLAAVPA